MDLNRLIPVDSTSQTQVRLILYPIVGRFLVKAAESIASVCYEPIDNSFLSTD